MNRVYRASVAADREIGAALMVAARCPDCDARHLARAIWIQKCGRRVAVPVASITLLRAQYKLTELWVGRKVVGYCCCSRRREATLDALAARIGGRWLHVHRNARVRPDAIEAIRRNDVGVVLTVAGVDVPCSRRRWLAVKQEIGR